jgi:hypothetical protein
MASNPATNEKNFTPRNRIRMPYPDQVRVSTPTAHRSSLITGMILDFTIQATAELPDEWVMIPFHFALLRII